MEHIVTCYWQDATGKMKYQSVSKSNVPQFIELHKNVPHLIVCDPRYRTNTTYQYGKIQNAAS